MRRGGVKGVVPGAGRRAWVGGRRGGAAAPAAGREALNARQPHGRRVGPGEVAGARCYLASPRNRSTTGVLLPIDGGMTNLRTRR